MHQIVLKIIISIYFLYPSILLAAELNDKEIRMAETAILTSLIVQTNPKSQYLCTQNDYACLGVSQSDLGLALIAAKNSAQGLSGLANLSRFNLDGGLSEDYTCYVLSKGKKIEPHLKRVKPDLLIDECKIQATSFIHANKKIFDETQQPNICADENAVRERVKYLLMGIKRGDKCSY